MFEMFFICPNCGAEVDANATSCPECGSDERTGWSDDTLYDGLDLPDEAFDEGHQESMHKRRRKDVFLLVIGLLFLLIFILRFIFGL